MDRNDLRRRNLIKFMALRGVDDKELARRTGKDPRQIGNVLSGRSPIGPKLVKEFADKLDIDDKELDRWDQSLDESSTPPEIVQAMYDLKHLLLEAKGDPDGWHEYFILSNLNMLRKGVNQDLKRISGMMEKINKLEKDIAELRGRTPGAATPTRKAGRAKKGTVSG